MISKYFMANLRKIKLNHSHLFLIIFNMQKYEFKGLSENSMEIDV